MSDQTSGSNASGYRVLARKYRPRVFPDLIGQEAMVRTLTNALASGRIAQAYMLTGVRGVGKTTTARLIARAINYPSGPTVDMPEVTPQCEAILESLAASWAQAITELFELRWPARQETTWSRGQHTGHIQSSLD